MIWWHQKTSIIISGMSSQLPKIIICYSKEYAAANYGYGANFLERFVNFCNDARQVVLELSEDSGRIFYDVL